MYTENPKTGTCTMSNGEEPGKMHSIWVCTVCSELNRPSEKKTTILAGSYTLWPLNIKQRTIPILLHLIRCKKYSEYKGFIIKQISWHT